MGKKHELAVEAKVAKSIGALVNDVTLDLDEVGKYLAHIQPRTSYNRVLLVAEAAAEEVEKLLGRE